MGRRRSPRKILPLRRAPWPLRLRWFLQDLLRLRVRPFRGLLGTRRRRHLAVWIAIAAPVLVASGFHQEMYARVADIVDPGRGCVYVRVVDGDTVNAHCPGQGVVSVRLLGFDTPEVWSPSCLREFIKGTRATWALRWRILTAGEARFVLSGTDRYGRRLGTMFIDGENVAKGMIADGLARAYDGGRRLGWCGVEVRRKDLPQI